MNTNKKIENIVLKIQKRFLIKKFYRNLGANQKLFYLLESYTCCEENDKQFNEMKNILTNQQNIQNVQKLIDYLYRYYGVHNDVAPRINARKFLVAWMIVSLPEYMMQIKKPKERKTEYPIDIFFICQDIITYTQSLLTDKTKENLRKFKKAFNVYSNAINYFLARDKHEHIRKLINEFIDINKTIDGIKKSSKYSQKEKDSCLSIISKTKEKMACHLKKMDSNIELLQLEVMSKIQNTVEDNMEKAMIDVVTDDIKTRKLSYFDKLLNDIIDKLKIENFNKNIMMQQITYGNITHEQISGYGDQFISLIKLGESEWTTIKSKMYESNEFLARMVIFISRLLQ